MDLAFTKDVYQTPDLYTIISEQENDAQWNHFVENNPAGFHEQTSMWASVKMLGGWKPIRVKFLQNQRIIGGFQILWKEKKYFGRIAYLSKGPLMDSFDTILWNLMIHQFKKVVNDYCFKAIIIIPSSDQLMEKFELTGNEFKRNKIFPVINTTLQIDLSQSTDNILRGMRKRLRTTLKNHSGLKFREGTENDLEIFFDMMQITCRHQKVIPNPGDVEILKKLWSLFYNKNMIRLYISEKENEIVNGVLALIIRDHFIAWKIGWSGKYRNLSPNAAIIWDLIKTAKSEGLRIFDFVSVDHGIAQQIKSKKKLNDSIMRNPTFFKLGFGGNIVKLPDSFIFIPNTAMRSLYSMACLFKKSPGKYTKS